MSRIMDVNKAMKSEAVHRNRLLDIKAELTRIANRIEDSVKVEYTGEFVLLKRKGETWECVGIFNPDTWDGEELEWDQCLPIPKTETMPEFSGW